VGDYAAQAQRAMDNLVSALVAAGATLEKVLSTRVLVASARQSDLVAAWAVVRDRFGSHDAPSTLFGVTVLGYPDQLVEIEAVAAVVDCEEPVQGPYRFESVAMQQKSPHQQPGRDIGRRVHERPGKYASRFRPQPSQQPAGRESHGQDRPQARVDKQQRRVRHENHDRLQDIADLETEAPLEYPTEQSSEEELEHPPSVARATDCQELGRLAGRNRPQRPCLLPLSFSRTDIRAFARHRRCRKSICSWATVAATM
jgi:hypothetical protein